MLQSVLIAGLAIASATLLGLLFVATPLAVWCATLLIVAIPGLLIALGALKNGKLGPIALPLLLFFLLQEGCVIGMLLLRGEVMDGVWIGGLPLGAALQIYGSFLLPFFLISLTYAFTFERFGLGREEWEQFKANHGRSKPEEQGGE